MTPALPGDSDLRTRNFERILLIKPSSLGDVVHALPVLHGLRVRYPQSKIDWLIATPFAPLVASHPELDEAVLFDRQRFAGVGRSPSATRAFAGFVRELRARRYDLAVDLQGLFRSGFLSWASGARVRIGLGDSREGARLFHTHRTGVSPSDAHAVDRNYAVSAWLGFESVPIEFKMALGDEDRAGADALLRSSGGGDSGGIGDDERPIVIAPGARWETKVWPPDRFTSAIDRWQAGGQKCVLVGSGDERALCDRIAAACRTSPINLCGKTPLRLLPPVVDRAGLVVAHDSAVMHLAVALERPLVCIVGPTNPKRTGPYRRENDVVRLDLDCAPCYLRRLAKCPYDHRCMNELTVDEVVEAGDRALARSMG